MSIGPVGEPARRDVLRAMVAALSLGGVAGLAGCGLPQSDVVQPGHEVGGQGLPPLRQQFDGPTPGATAVEVVTGFLNASLDSAEDSASARLFLTPEASAAWHPASGILVYEAGTSPTVTVRGDEATVTVPSIADVDSDGRYAEHAAGSTATLRIGLTRVSTGMATATASVGAAAADGESATVTARATTGRSADASAPGGTGGRHSGQTPQQSATGVPSSSASEWRISALPEDFGVWMSRFYFEQLYAAVQVAYAVPGRDELVGDSRYIAVTSGMATALARALLSQVPDYLNAAVGTGFPAHTGLTVDAVPVEQGVARLEMSAQLLDTPPDQLRLVWAQTLATLTQDRRVSVATPEVNGQAIPIAGRSDTPKTLSDLGFSWSAGPDMSRLVVRRGTSLSVVTPGALTSQSERSQDGPAKDPGLPTIPAGWDWVAVSGGVDHVAAVSGDRRELRIWPATGDAHTITTLGSDLSRPRFAPDGTLWVLATGGARASARPVVRVLGVNAELTDGAKVVSLTPPEGLTLLDIAIAAEGTRLAMLARDGKRRLRVGIAGIHRDGMRPVSLAPPLWVGRRVVDALSVCWVGADSLAVVGRTSLKEAYGPLLVSVAGPTTALPALPDTREVRAWRGPQSVLAKAGADTFYELGGQRWVKVAAASDIIVPGS